MSTQENSSIILTYFPAIIYIYIYILCRISSAESVSHLLFSDIKTAPPRRPTIYSSPNNNNKKEEEKKKANNNNNNNNKEAEKEESNKEKGEDMLQNTIALLWKSDGNLSASIYHLSSIFLSSNIFFDIIIHWSRFHV